ncbi:hypothetical protein [Yinghuangia soli]|uniref:Uncharacterized protein n=1 Tax=Yinghuangia soli TaxID=2908204 RepID=A0AA41TYB4_9ACTN|nr:hypothetical protein [Yinghuangia soli]MCF2526216.1 hypothetical protein [Yinghuangia soli]
MTGRSDGQTGVLVFTAYLADDVPDDELVDQAREMDQLYAELRGAGVNAEVRRPEEAPEGFRGVEPQALLTIAIGMGQALAVNVIGDILVRWLRGSRFRRVREQRPDGTSEIGGVDPPLPEARPEAEPATEPGAAGAGEDGAEDADPGDDDGERGTGGRPDGAA